MGDVTIDVAIQYNESYTEDVLTYVNNINTLEGGTHLVLFEDLITGAWFAQTP